MSFAYTELSECNKLNCFQRFSIKIFDNKEGRSKFVLSTHRIQTIMASFFPNGFEERVKPQLQDEWPEFINAHHREPPVSIRINPTKKNFTLPVDPVPWTSSGFYLPQRPVFTLDPSFHAGAYYVQEASSMFLEQAFKQIIPTNKPLRVLDLCAAPGGKSTHSEVGKQQRDCNKQ
jgi:16S rRNA C967 or C1407 C5-methylase (RsmB/RsmF family)